MVLPENGIIDLVDSSTTPGVETSTAHGSSSNGSLEYVANDCSASLDIEPQAQITLSPPGRDFTSSVFKGPICTCTATADMENLVPLESDEILLSIYTNQLSSMQPFVIIPAGTTPRQLQKTRPFLMKVIRMVASVRHLRTVRSQSRAAIAHVSNAILIRSERSLDLLQGILVFLGFYHYHCMAHAQFNNLIHLAVGLIEDLDLNTCPKSQQIRKQMPLIRATERPMYRTREEKRALLGVWYMSSK
jgi:hypothetical protein